jgi:predicted Zn-dependent peptidase
VRRCARSCTRSSGCGAEEISTDELTLATSYLDGVFPIRYETTSRIATALSNLVIHDLPEHFYDDYRVRVRSVTTEDVLRAAQRHLHPDRYASSWSAIPR